MCTPIYHLPFSIFLCQSGVFQTDQKCSTLMLSLSFSWQSRYASTRLIMRETIILFADILAIAVSPSSDSFRVAYTLPRNSEQRYSCSWITSLRSSIEKSLSPDKNFIVSVFKRPKSLCPIKFFLQVLEDCFFAASSRLQQTSSTSFRLRLQTHEKIPPMMESMIASSFSTVQPFWPSQFPYARLFVW